MNKPPKKLTEDDLVAAIMKVKPTADMPRYPKTRAKKKPNIRKGN